MATIHISQAEAERNISDLLSRLNDDTSFIIENDSRPVALLQSAPSPRPSLRERIAQLPSNSKGRIDKDFPRDVDEAVERHRAPLDSTSWD